MIRSAEEFVELRTSDDPELYRRAMYDDASDEVWMGVIERYPHLRNGVVCNKTVPTHILRILAHDSDPRVRYEVATTGRTEPDILALLASDTDASVRNVVAKIAERTRMRLEMLKQAKNMTRSAALRSKSQMPSGTMITSAEEFVELRTSDDPEMYGRATHDPAPDEVWLDVIERYPDMRKWVLHNKTTPVHILRVLACDPDPDVRCDVVGRHRTTSDILEMLASDHDPAVRRATAGHANTPRATLLKLAEDPWRETAEIAKAHLAFLDFGNRRLARSEDPRRARLLAFMREHVDAGARPWFVLFMFRGSRSHRSVLMDISSENAVSEQDPIRWTGNIDALVLQTLFNVGPVRDSLLVLPSIKILAGLIAKLRDGVVSVDATFAGDASPVQVVRRDLDDTSAVTVSYRGKESLEVYVSTLDDACRDAVLQFLKGLTNEQRLALRNNEDATRLLGAIAAVWPEVKQVT